MATTNGTTSNGTPPTTHILIVGAGPVGLLLAVRLAQANISITVLEAQPSIEKQSKAIVYMPPVYPELKRAGLLDAMFAAGTTIKPPVFMKTATKEVLVSMPDGPPGAPKILLLPQWRVQEIFLEKLRGMVKEGGGVEVRMGWEVFSVDDSASETVVVKARSGSGEEQAFTADYVIGADGGRSFVRRAVAIPFEGETLPHQLVATDVRYPFEQYGYSDTQFMLDAENYGVVSRIDRDGLWRLSFGVRDGATREEIEEMVPRRYEAMFPAGAPRPLKYEVCNVAPYRCQQLCAKTFRKGGMLLAGDAAHCEYPTHALRRNEGAEKYDSDESVFWDWADYRLFRCRISSRLPHRHYTAQRSLLALRRVVRSPNRGL